MGAETMSDVKVEPNWLEVKGVRRKKKRGRKKKSLAERPDCTRWIQQFPIFEKVPYPNLPDGLGTFGLFVFRTTRPNELAVVQYKEDKDRKPCWNFRYLKTAPPSARYHYDVVYFTKFQIDGLIAALGRLKETFGGEEGIAKSYHEIKEHAEERKVAKEIKEIDGVI
jgi:hypothetical protein